MDAAILDVEAVEELSVSLLVPADVVIEAVDVGGMAGGQWLAKVFLHLGPEGVEAHRMDRIFEPGHFAVGAVTKIPLHLHHRLGDRKHVFRRHEAQPLGERGEGLGGARRHPQATAGEDVVAENPSALVDREEAEIVGVDVDAVVFRQCEAGFELSRQIGAAINWFDNRGSIRPDLLRPAGHPALLASLRIGEPELVIGAGPRGEVAGKFVCLRLHFGMDTVAVERRRAAHDIPLHVTAGCQRGHLVGVDLLHEVLQFSLDHAMVLDGLPRREPDRAVAEFVSHVDGRQQLLGGELAAGHAGADHERNLPLALLAVGRLLAGLAVILLVGTVVLEELHAGLAETGHAVDEFLGHVAQQVITRLLRNFDGGKLGGGSGFV